MSNTRSMKTIFLVQPPFAQLEGSPTILSLPGAMAMTMAMAMAEAASFLALTFLKVVYLHPLSIFVHSNFKLV